MKLKSAEDPEMTRRRLIADITMQPMRSQTPAPKPGLDKTTGAPPAENAPLPFDRTSSRNYLKFQFGVWSFFLVFALISFAGDRNSPDIKPYLIGAKVGEIILMGVCSHFIWLAARRYHWLAGNGRGRFQSLAACLVAATIITAAVYPLALFLHDSRLDAHASPHVFYLTIVGEWLGIAVCLVIWGALYRAYYYQDRNRRLETEHARMETERARLLAATREAQLIALKGHINPHFLFNSLNTLRALIQVEPAAARDAVTHLADMMRYTLTLSDYSVIPLAAEIEFVNDYLALEHLRHEQRLHIQKKITPEALPENIPPMLLQTLVENAVKHGLRQRAEGIVVTMDIWLSGPYAVERSAGTQLHLRVTNQGTLAPSAGAAASGTGLRNARERLRLIYGSRATLDVSERDGLVVAEATLPLPPPAPGAAARATDPLATR